MSARRIVRASAPVSALSAVPVVGLSTSLTGQEPLRRRRRGQAGVIDYSLAVWRIAHTRARPPEHSAALDQLLQPLQRLVGLGARRAYDRTAREPAQRPARQRVLVRVGEIRAAVVLGEVVGDLGLRAERALALPHG